MVCVIYDESMSPELYRFRSFLRLLMDVHPRVGASNYALSIGSRPNLVPGWNAIHQAADAEAPVRYIYIPPPGSQEGGLNTEERPNVPVEQIHISREDDLPPFEGSSAWRQVMQLSEVLREQPPQGISAGWVRERVDRLHALAGTPLRGNDAGVDDRIGQILAGIRDAVNGSGGSLATFAEPVTVVIDDCLDFRLTKRQASNILAVLLTYYAVKFPSPFDKTGGVEPVKQQIDYLIGQVSSITHDRHGYDLGSYTQLTYLGLLLADAALIIAKILASRKQDEKVIHWANRRALYVEEWAVHNLMPSLSHPVSLAPFGTVEYLRARKVGIVNPTGLYQGAGEIGDKPLIPEEVWPRVQAYSTTCKRLEANYGTFGNVISPALTEHLSHFVLTMKLGQSMSKKG